MRVGEPPSEVKTSTSTAGHPRSSSQGCWSELRSVFYLSDDIWRIDRLLTQGIEKKYLRGRCAHQTTVSPPHARSLAWRRAGEYYHGRDRRYRGGWGLRGRGEGRQRRPPGTPFERQKQLQVTAPVNREAWSTRPQAVPTRARALPRGLRTSPKASPPRRRTRWRWTSLQGPRRGYLQRGQRYAPPYAAKKRPKPT